MTAANIEDNLDAPIAYWIVEAVIENLDIKHDLYAKRSNSTGRRHAIVSSNTSTIPLASSSSRAAARISPKNFLITHFFNPPRYMRLLEVVAGPKTTQKRWRDVARIRRQSPRQGPRRLQGYAGLHRQPHRRVWIEAALIEAIEAGFTVEEADAVMGRPIGFPRPAFRLVRPDRYRPHAAVAKSLLDNAARRTTPSAGLRGAGAGQEDDRRRLYRPQGQGGFDRRTARAAHASRN